MNRLIVITGPSASGKTSVLESIKEYHQDVKVVKSYTTRRPRFQLDDSYHYVTLDEFQKSIKDEEFMEFEEVYPGTYYGTKKIDVIKTMNEVNVGSIPNSVFMIMDVKGALKVKKQMGEKCIVFFLNPGGFEIIESRLKERGSSEDLEARKIRYSFEMSFKDFFDYEIESNSTVDETAINIEEMLVTINKKTNQPLVVNLYGGPGTGKSTMASAVFSELKFDDVNCELVTEYAKDKVWENSLSLLKNQIYVFGKQHHRIWRLLDNVDVIITDSPLLLSSIYTNDYTLKELIIQEHLRMNNLEIFLTRENKFNPKGRIHNYAQSLQKDVEMKELLDSRFIQYTTFPSNKKSIQGIVELIKKKMER